MKTWYFNEFERHVGNPVRIIRIFAIHTGILLPSIVGAVSVIVVKIYTCVRRRGVFFYLQHNLCTEMRVSNR